MENKTNTYTVLMANVEKFHNTVLRSDIVKLANQIDQANSEGQLEPPVSGKFAGMVDHNTFKEIAEFVELEINEKHSKYWSSIGLGNASGRFWQAYKRYASKFSR